MTKTKTDDPVQMTKEEAMAFNVLNNTVQKTQEAAKDAIAARQAYLDLVGLKYDATFDMATGAFKRNEKTDGS